MKRTVERHEWVIYEMSPREFAQKLGIDDDKEMVVSVIVVGGKVEVSAQVRRNAE